MKTSTGVVLACILAGLSVAAMSQDFDPQQFGIASVGAQGVGGLDAAQFAGLGVQGIQAVQGGDFSAAFAGAGGLEGIEAGETPASGDFNNAGFAGETQNAEGYETA